MRINKRRRRSAMRNLRWLLLLVSVAALGCSEFDRTRVKAWMGDAEAQYELGVMYHEGKEVPQDDAEAVRLRRSLATSVLAASWSSRSRSRTGVSLRRGRGQSFARCRATWRS